MLLEHRNVSVESQNRDQNGIDNFALNALEWHVFALFFFFLALLHNHFLHVLFSSWLDISTPLKLVLLLPRKIRT